MKNYVLLGGHDWSDAGFYDTAIKAIKQVVKNNIQITFIESRFHTHEKNSEGVKRILSWFSYHGIEFSQYHIIDSRLTVEEQHRIIKNSEVIFINGGDTMAQMSTLNKNGLVGLLHNFEGPIIGISAGAINMAKYSLLPLTKLRSRSYEFKGTGLVDVTITPHFDINRRDYIVSEVLPMSYKGVIYALEENGVVLVNGDEVSFYGGVYKIHNGEIVKIN